LFFCCVILNGSTQPIMNPAYDNIFSLIYHFRFNDARQFIDSIETQPGSLNSIKAYLLYWEALSGIDPDKKLNEAEHLISKILTAEKDPYNEVSLKLLKIRILITQQRYMSVLLTINELKSFFQNYPLKDNDTPYNKLIWGLYHFYASEARNTNMFYAKYLSSWPGSDKNLGLMILDSILNEKNVFVKNEGLYFLFRINAEIELNDALAEKYLLMLQDEYPENSIYKELFLKFLLRKNRVVEFQDIKVKFLAFIESSVIFSQNQITHFKNSIQE